MTLGQGDRSISSCQSQLIHESEDDEFTVSVKPVVDCLIMPARKRAGQWDGAVFRTADLTEALIIVLPAQDDLVDILAANTGFDVEFGTGQRLSFNNIHNFHFSNKIGGLIWEA